MSWMTKHTNNLLGDMPIDNKASALNHTSFPVHQHPHSAIDPDAPGVPGTPGYEPKVKRSELDTKGKKIFDKPFRTKVNSDKAVMEFKAFQAKRKL